MNCWEILGIEPTENLQKVKQAYAKKLKTIDIKNDIEKFQKLKEAFDLAKKITQLKQDEQENVIDEEISTFQVNSTVESYAGAENQLSPGTTTLEITNFKSSLTSFLEEEVFYDEVANWQIFLQSYLLVDIESFREIQIFLRSFLIDYYQIISREVRTYIFEISQMDDTYGEYDYILNYPDFNFSFYQEISLHERREYFQTRNQLFLLLFQPDSLDDLSELLQHCKYIYRQDSDLILLEAYWILWQDFRLENPKNISYIKELIQNHRENESSWEFVRTYSDFIFSKKKSKGDWVNPESIFRMNDKKIPTAIYELLAGNCAYLTGQHQAMYYYWHELQEKYPEKFIEQETFNAKEIKKHTFFYNWRFVIVGILIVRILFKIGQMGAISSPLGAVSDVAPTAYSALLSDLQDSRTDDSWESSEPIPDETPKNTTFRKDLKMFSTNPNDDEPVSYESYAEGGFSASVPNYEHYNQSDAETILGAPSQIVEDAEVIQYLLEEHEEKIILSETNQGNLTEEQGKAFKIQAFDSKAVVNRVLVYKEGKPNIYLSGDKVIYITPITKYINFNGKLK
ncbi:DUF4947 domain-containing protein [Enterococcus faecalis]|jgi:cell fate (sporulation/competence/biofilm development) regulator YlbF (YheA/YmcA/DUF963 family)|uniref:DUF4947 domain-containing protein n=1 Tax=Enterococcus faecalis TaxID=1351 RepID=UPI00206AC84D|nr:DUF4947 domain-containing protein [Enterococcus faecalis]BDH63980.1 hypothetical protein MTP05_01650 [Enterococcus sp. PLM3]